MSYPIKVPRKLIEVALPLDAINAACSREKSIRHGHPSTLHLWWARRPLAAARAVLFAQMVNDPSFQQRDGFKYGMNKKAAAVERRRLFKIIEDLVKWESTTDEEILERARVEIRRSWREICELNRAHPEAATLFNPSVLPAAHDPFAGGGTIPVEAQRLGLSAFATDLNPVSVLINKAMIEVPPLMRGRKPVSRSVGVSALRPDLGLDEDWSNLKGIAEDVRFYGEWMRDEAYRRIGAQYPQIVVDADMIHRRPDLKPLKNKRLVVTAWIWARTVKSPNPAFSNVDVPLAPTYVLSSKVGAEAYLSPVVAGNRYHFEVKFGQPDAAAKNGTKASGRGANFRCLVSGAPISPTYIRDEAAAGRMGQRLLAVVAETDTGRAFLDPTTEMEEAADAATPNWKPDVEFFPTALGFRIGNYGMKRWSDLFTARQLVALSTFGELVSEMRSKVIADGLAAGESDDGVRLQAGGTGLTAHADALALYLSFAVSRASDYWGRGTIWESSGMFIAHVFSRNALPMTWDYPEANPFSNGSGSWSQTCVDWIARYLRGAGCYATGSAEQADAQSQETSLHRVVSTDPPYYDNIGYADLSDYFYVWLRRSLRSVFPQLLATITVPKAEELVATPDRHGGRSSAEQFFLTGMTSAMRQIAVQAHPAFPATIYYAFKQAETETASGTTSTGWETFLEAVIAAGFAVVGTWPMRTERPGRMRDNASNALASSIVLVCCIRAEDAPTVSRRQFVRELNDVLPSALDDMTRGAGEESAPVAPVDLSQAIIGPGMAVFSKYAAVLEADGSRMSVRGALQLINRFLAEDDFDADTQFCLHWFEQHGWGEGTYGDANTLAQSKGTAPDGLKEAGVLESGHGKVRLLRWAEYPTGWDPRADRRTPIWEALHQLIRALKQGGEAESGALLNALDGKAEAARQLAYRMYTMCERLGQAEDARAYNELITSWTGIETAAASQPKTTDPQGLLFDR